MLFRSLPGAAELGVKLGIEGRSHYEQVPSEDEMDLLMQEFGFKREYRQGVVGR